MRGVSEDATAQVEAESLQLCKLQLKASLDFLCVCQELEPGKKPFRVLLPFTRTLVPNPKALAFCFFVVEESGYISMTSMSPCPEILEQNSIKYFHIKRPIDLGCANLIHHATQNSHN